MFANVKCYPAETNQTDLSNKSSWILLKAKLTLTDYKC